MDVLHILRSEPDETTRTLIEVVSGAETHSYALYEGEVDWNDLLDRIFEAPKVISWW